jgi:hypothetical protein
MNTEIGATVGTPKQTSFSTNLPTITSLELDSRSSAFNLNTNLSYADNGVSNAGNITVTGNSSVTLTGGSASVGSFESTKAQTYNATLTLGSNITMNATTVTTNSTLAGAGYNLTVNNVAAANSGNLVTGGDSTNLNNLWVTGNSTLNGNVSSTGNQTYNGTLTLGTDVNLNASNATATVKLNSTVNSNASAPHWLNINLSTAGGNVILNASNVVITEDGTGTSDGSTSNNWGKLAPSGVIFTSHVTASATDSGTGSTITFFAGATGLTSVTEQTGTTVTSDITKCLNTLAVPVAPQETRRFSFQRSGYVCSCYRG